MRRVSALVAFSLIAAVPAFAEDLCSVPQDKWMTEDALKAKLTEAGFDIRQVKVEDGCYEIYAIDKDGKKVEALVNPETAEIVKNKADD